MKRRSSKLWAAGAIALAGTAALAALTVQLTPVTPVGASDHIDSPTIAQDRGADIADLWAFLDPNDNSKAVLIMSTQGFIVSGEHFGMPIFDHNIRYRFEIENTGDARPDKFVDVTYSRGLGRQMPQTATVTLPDGRRFSAQTTVSTQELQPTPAPTPVVTTDPASGVSFFGGNADDPFFLDDTGANLTVASAIAGHVNKSLLGQRGRDTYAGFNTLITAVRVPVALLRGSSNVIGINAVTQRQRYQVVLNNGGVQGFGEAVQVDRDGNPLVNNGLIPAPRKNEYNGAPTADDARGRFQADLVTSMRAFGTDTAHINMVLDQVQRKGDILRLDTSVPNTGPQGGNNPNGGFGHMGGRRLTDDVVDGTFTILNNGVPLGDNVNGNDVPFRSAFPFVADPTQPFPAGGDPDDHTRQ